MANQNGTREAAAAFLADHDRLEKECAELKKSQALLLADNDRLRVTTEALQAAQTERDNYFIDELRTANRQKMLYLRYSVELSAQLQFVVAGCSRALKLAGTVQSLYDEQMDAGTIPAVPEADVKELERLMSSITARAPRVDAMIKPPGIEPGTPPATEAPGAQTAEEFVEAVNNGNNKIPKNKLKL